jgi:hypothetical protein
MDRDGIILRRLAAQHLLEKADTEQVVQDLCGVQAQFLSHALHGLSIRCDPVSTENLVKNWTNRGTMHLISADDLPLFLHRGRTHYLRPVDTMEADAYMSKARKAYFADLILSAVEQGTDERDVLKTLCIASGMTESEAVSAFNPWGGLIRALCETGKLCHKVQEKKAFQLCPPFEPWEEKPAHLELARRYFSHFGPATVKDCAYFFGSTQKNVKQWLRELPVEETHLDGNSYFYIPGALADDAKIPAVLFLAGFDQFLLGYEKKESLILPQEHLRDIFNLAGIVRPAVLIHGRVAGWWNLKKRKLTVSLFSPAYQEAVLSAAALQWDNLKEIHFV